MAFTYHRRIHFSDTDAAGVVFFANVCSMCHEAYEASLIASGISLREFFNNSSCAIPIVESQSKFFYPLRCGDRVQISLTPQLISLTEFSIVYHLALMAEGAEADSSQPKRAAWVLTRHVAIEPTQRRRCPVPSNVLEWIDQWGEGPSEALTDENY